MEDQYFLSEYDIAISTLKIDPEGLTARKLKRIGVDIVEEQKAARIIVEEHDREQHIQDK